MISNELRDLDARLSQADPIDRIAIAERRGRLLSFARAVNPGFAAGLVRHGIWPATEVLDLADRMDLTQRAEYYAALLPILSDPSEILRRTEAWNEDPMEHHVGMWVLGHRGGDFVLAALAKRLPAPQAFEICRRIRQPDALVDALRALPPTADWMEIRDEAVRRAREWDHVRLLCALCSLSELFEPARALELVREAVSALPTGDKRWEHYPGGFMVIPLALPVARALRGHPEEIERMKREEGPEFSNWLRVERPAERDPMEQARAGHLVALYWACEKLPEAHVREAFELVLKGERTMENQRSMFVFARRLGELPRVLPILREHSPAIRWEGYEGLTQIWHWDGIEPDIAREVLRVRLGAVARSVPPTPILRQLLLISAALPPGDRPALAEVMRPLVPEPEILPAVLEPMPEFRALVMLAATSSADPADLLLRIRPGDPALELLGRIRTEADALAWLATQETHVVHPALYRHGSPALLDRFAELLPTLPPEGRRRMAERLAAVPRPPVGRTSPGLAGLPRERLLSLARSLAQAALDPVQGFP